MSLMADSLKLTNREKVKRATRIYGADQRPQKVESIKRVTRCMYGQAVAKRQNFTRKKGETRTLTPLLFALGQCRRSLRRI